MKSIFFLLLSMNFFTSCQKGVAHADSAVSLPEKTMMNVAYGSDSLQKMDVYLPANRNRENTKVMVLIHGGAWMEGDKQDFASSVHIFKKRLPDYAIVSINYRLATQVKNHFPTQENDVKAAIQFLHNKKEEYIFSDDYVLLGASAGGHLALLHAYKHTEPVHVKAVVSFFGPADMLDMYNSQTSPFYQAALGVLIGGTPATNLAAFQQSSPIHFVNTQSPPTLLLHGARDYLVNVSQSENLKKALQAARATVQLVVYPTEGHGWYGANLEDSYNKIEAFLKANVH